MKCVITVMLIALILTAAPAMAPGPEGIAFDSFSMRWYSDDYELHTEIIGSHEELALYAKKHQFENGLYGGAHPQEYLDMAGDKGFFDERIVIVVMHSEGSGSISHEVSGVEVKDGALRVAISRFVPEIGTDDMASYHTFVVIARGDYGGEEIEVEFSTVSR